MRVSWGIYRQALALRLRGVPFHPHPDKAEADPAGSPRLDAVGDARSHQEAVDR
jgi:DUF1365 family protein